MSYTCVIGLIDHVSEEVDDIDHVARARVLQSLIPLTPNITKILSSNFDKVKQQIDQRMTKLLTNWIESLINQMTSKLSKLKPSSCLECLPAWDQVRSVFHRENIPCVSKIQHHKIFSYIGENIGNR